jgi:hypothetical protein
MDITPYGAEFVFHALGTAEESIKTVVIFGISPLLAKTEI